MNLDWNSRILIRLGMQLYDNYVRKGSVLISNAKPISKVSVPQIKDTAILSYYGLDVYIFKPLINYP